MGFTLNAVCRACGWRRGFRLGAGFAYTRENLLNLSGKFSLLSLIPEEDIRRKVTLLVEHYHATLREGGHGVARCDGCGRLTERFFFVLDHSGESRVFRPDYRCFRCNGVLREWIPRYPPDVCSYNMAADLSSLPCPRCGRYDLYDDVTYHLFWD